MRSIIFALLTIAYLLAPSYVVRADNSKPTASGLKILFVGNSYTSWAEDTLSFFASQTENNALLKFHTVGGSHLSLFANEEIEYGKDFLGSLKSQPWDYVVLQDRSVAVGRGDDWDDAFKKSVSKLSKVIREVGAEPVLYMTWGRDNTKDYEDYEDMNEKVTQGYLSAGKREDAIVAPVGKVWHQVRVNNERLGMKLYEDANGHPTQKGQVLIAGVFFKLFFNDALDWQEKVSEVLSEEEWSEIKQAIVDNTSAAINRGKLK